MRIVTHRRQDVRGVGSLIQLNGFGSRVPLRLGFLFLFCFCFLMNAFCLCKTFFICFLICNFSRRQISLFLSGVGIEKVPRAYPLVYFKINTHFSKFPKFGERQLHVHTVRPHMPSSSQIQSACYKKVKSGIENPVWNESMVDSHLRKLLWVYCPGHDEVKGNN